jgi:hypothetical protein
MQMTERKSTVLMGIAMFACALTASAPAMAQARWGHADQPVPRQSYGMGWQGSYGQSYAQGYASSAPYQSYGYDQGWGGAPYGGYAYDYGSGPRGYSYMNDPRFGPGYNGPGFGVDVQFGRRGWW